LENLSEDKQNAFLADGVQDDIRTALAKVADLKVINRTSVNTYVAGTRRNLREIAQTLGVAFVLEGSVHQSGEKVSITAQLTDARSGAPAWQESYERDLADVFAIQGDISELSLSFKPLFRRKRKPRSMSARLKIPSPMAFTSAPRQWSRRFQCPNQRKLREAVDLLDWPSGGIPTFPRLLPDCRRP
jgi:TolB-like protein